MPKEVTTVAVKSAASAVGDVPVRTLGDAKIPYDVLRYIPEESAQHYRLAPLAGVDGNLEIGIGGPA